MPERRVKSIPKNSEKLGHEFLVKDHFNTEKVLLKKLKERKEVYNEFLTQIDNFIDYANEQAENNNSNDKLEPKYEEIIGEEESLRDKIREHLKKNDELIESLQKSNFKHK